MNYHWLSDLFERLQLPRLDGMEAVLKQANVKRIEKMRKKKTETARRKEYKSKARHRVDEQLVRKNWGKSQSICHTYGKSEQILDNTPHSSPLKSDTGTPSRHLRSKHSVKQSKVCKCGSTSHSRTSHFACPLNKIAVGSDCDSDYDLALSDDESVQSEDEIILTESENECTLSSSDDEQLHCSCHDRAHSRECPLNPMNKRSHSLENTPEHSGNSSCSKESLKNMPEHSDNLSHSKESLKNMPEDSGNLSHSKESLENMPEGSSDLSHSKESLENMPEHFGNSSRSKETESVVSSSNQLCGPLPSLEWKQCACDVVECWSGLTLINKPEPIKHVSCPEVLPHIVDSIVGDGNCFFRAISKEITGTQENHQAIRLAITRFMSGPEDALSFGHAFFGIEEPLSKLTAYMKTSGVCHNAWGTEKEIYVAATLFQVDIVIYSEYGKQGRTWLYFHPIFSNNNCAMAPAGIKIYLYHTLAKDHYHRVVPCLP